VSSVRLTSWIVFVGGVAALNYAARFQHTSGNGQNVVYSWSDFTTGLVVYLFFLGIVLAIASGRWDLLAFRRPRSWGKAAALAAAIVVAIFLAEYVVSLLPLPQSPGKEQGLTPTHWEPRHAAAFAANVVLFSLIAPTVEELAFRGVGQSLLRMFGRWPSIVLVGVAFGLWHGLFEALLVLVPFGILLAYLRDRTESVVPGIVVHGLFNGLALAAAVVL
jgi:membrane protease YdiL (CAAX protease family)